MEITRYNGSSGQGAEAIAEKLEVLKVDLETYQKNIRNLRYDRSLRPFFDVSRKINLLDQFARQNTDLVAERLIALGVSSWETSEYLPVLSRVPALTGPQNVEEAMVSIVRTSLRLMDTVKEAFYVAADYNDAATLSVLSHIARQITITVHIFSNERMALQN